MLIQQQTEFQSTPRVGASYDGAGHDHAIPVSIRAPV